MRNQHPCVIQMNYKLITAEFTSSFVTWADFCFFVSRIAFHNVMKSLWQIIIIFIFKPVVSVWNTIEKTP